MAAEYCARVLIQIQFQFQFQFAVLSRCIFVGSQRTENWNWNWNWTCMASARRYQDLKAWQHAARLRDGVLAITATSPLSNDRRICDQLRRAAQSACANLAEGFGRYGPREFAHFVGIARSSLDEVQEHLRYCQLAGHLSAEEAQRLTLLAREAAATCTGLMRYLKSPAAQQNAGLRVRNQKNQDPTQS